MKIAVAFSLAVLCALASASASQYLVENLPGAPANLPFEIYSGNIDIGNGTNMFFIYVAAVDDTPETPVTLWLNGGPGCSSIGGGMFSENGPLWPNANNGLDVNPYAWNRVSHVVYLESPIGVGWSYSESMPAAYTADDQNTAENNYLFLQEFFAVFPQLATRPFWVSGESYGGHYVPELTLRIVEGNAAGDGVFINIQGFALGNAWTWSTIDNAGCVEDWWSHTFIAQDTALGMQAECNFGAIGPLTDAAGLQTETVKPLSASSTQRCNDLVNKAMKEMGNINIYDTYARVCVAAGPTQAESLFRALAQGPENHGPAIMGRQLSTAMASRREAALAATRLGGEAPAPPCISNYVQTYLNTPAVQQALHAPALPYNWTDCSTILTYDYTDVLTSVLPVYQSLFEHSLKLLVYSGDVDAIVPTPGTKAWLSLLNLTQTDGFRSWTYDTEGQVGGWVTEYAELTFATVRNAGHMVPGTQPKRAYEMFSRFISGKKL